jgi:hypothetical protein
MGQRETGQPDNLNMEKVMSKKLVSIVKFEKLLESVRKAVELSKGLNHLPANAKVFIKPIKTIPILRK